MFKKRSILIKLIFGFALVSLIAVVLVTFSATYNTGREFNTYLLTQDRTSILNHFTEYYTQHRSWAGVENTLDTLYKQLKLNSSDPVHPAFTLTDENETVLIPGGYYKRGDKLLQNDRPVSREIIVDGKVVGYLIIRDPLPRPGAEPAGFVQRVNHKMVLSGIAAFLLAILLGILFSKNFTKPIRELTLAARAVANGDLSQKVDVHSQDELGELSQVFNDMTTQLSRSIETRNQMTADIAHELRTPISIILGHTEAIHDGVLPPSEDTIEIIRQESIRLEKLVNQLRVLALSDAGELHLNSIPFSPCQLIQDVYNIFKYHTQAKHIHLAFDCPANLPPVRIDQDRMIQVFSNLVDNAICFTPRGGKITLAAFETDYQIEFTVTDTGQGISPQDLGRVFDRLYRTDQSRQRDGGGSGLGLAIAKSIVEQHGGKIWAESTLGKGTSMHVRLPIYTPTI